MERYDGAITIFSPDGNLFQVNYANEAVKKGSTVIGVRGKDCVVLAIEKRAIPVLQDERSVKKIFDMDEHIIYAFAGLSADARVLLDICRLECQNYRFTCEDQVPVGCISRFVANIKQIYTQCNGRRPFGLASIIAGFDYDGSPKLFKVDPSGVFYEFYACSVGRREETVMEFLEEHYSDHAVDNEESAVKLTIRALSQAIKPTADNMEIVVLRPVSADKPEEYIRRSISDPELTQLLTEMEGEQTTT